MPHWIEQTKGPHKRAVEDTIRAYKSGEISPEDAWKKLSSLYRKANDSHKPLRPNGATPPSFEKHAARGQEHIDYMIDTWFERYANVWYAGPAEKCRAEARRMTRRGVEEYEVFYEY
jgi:hypothetical protein